MKHCLAKLFFVLCVLFSTNCAADCNCSNEEMSFVPCPKTYVQPDQIDLYDGAIFVKINEAILQTKGLHSDAEGLFFEMIKGPKCHLWEWKCEKYVGRRERCNTCNWAWVHTCRKCKKGINEE